VIRSNTKRPEDYRQSRLPFILHLGNTSHSAGGSHTQVKVQLVSHFMLPGLSVAVTQPLCLSGRAILPRFEPAVRPGRLSVEMGHRTPAQALFNPATPILSTLKLKLFKKSNASSRGLIMPCSTYNF